jgi:hypothetical protein
MQPASPTGASEGGGSSNLRKWGPIAAIGVIVVAGVIALLVTAGGDDGDDEVATDTTAATSAPASSTATTAESSDTTAPGSTVPADTTSPAGTTAPGGEITFPLSFSQAAEAGIEVEWGARCDTETGQLAVADFFAPECYAPFEGDNGGETSRGVTGDTISLVVYQGPDEDPIIRYITDAITVDDTNAEEAATIDRMLEYYRQFYELYGRTVEVTYFEGSGIASDEVSARADAVRIAEEIQPFAVLGGPALTSAFADELAAREVLCVACTPIQPVEWYLARDPYVWGIDGSSIQKRAHVVEFATKQLAGQPAVHAGDPAYQTQTRTFGLVYIESSAESKNVADGYVQLMEDAGAPFAEVIPYLLDPNSIQQTASQAIARLKAAGVTSVIFVGDPVAPRDFTREATAQQYFPEWIIGASTLVDTTAFARTYDQEQWSNAFGVTQLAARYVPENGGYYRLYTWFTGEDPPAPDSINVFMPPVALFHSVAQAAGPNLTPESFRDALFLIGDTEPAITQPYLSWGERGLWDDPDYSGIDDATAIWWDPAATGPDEIRRDGTGMYRYVDGGARHLPGGWPTEDRMFVPDGAVTIYETPPPGEEVPDYPSPAG